jgi:PHD/YefM family antitoxin component YafN of YafNO toxin-antitoxin module
MPIIKPISDLRNYNEVLRDIDVGSPVFLTKNGRGRYVITDITEYERQQAEFRLLSELLKAEESVKEKGWVSEEEVGAMISDL